MTPPIDAVLCEAREEASVLVEFARVNIESMGPISYFHVRGANAGREMGLLLPEGEYTYQLELEMGMVPTPSDSEVESFALYSVEQTGKLLKGGF